MSMSLHWPGRSIDFVCVLNVPLLFVFSCDVQREAYLLYIASSVFPFKDIAVLLNVTHLGHTRHMCFTTLMRVATQPNTRLTVVKEFILANIT